MKIYQLTLPDRLDDVKLRIIEHNTTIQNRVAIEELTKLTKLESFSKSNKKLQRIVLMRLEQLNKDNGGEG